MGGHGCTAFVEARPVSGLPTLELYGVAPPSLPSASRKAHDDGVESDESTR